MLARDYERHASIRTSFDLALKAFVFSSDKNIISSKEGGIKKRILMENPLCVRTFIYHKIIELLKQFYQYVRLIPSVRALYQPLQGGRLDR